MREENESSVLYEGGDRRLSIGKVRLHNRHLQMGRAEASDCGICAVGLAGAFEEVIGDERPAPVDEGDGADKKEDATPPLDPWTN